MRVEIIRETDDGLRRQRWEFVYLIEGYSFPRLTLNLWTEETRPSKRRRIWERSAEGYKWRSHNGTIHFYGFRRPAAEVPMPDDVVAEARRIIEAATQIVGPKDPPEKERGR